MATLQTFTAGLSRSQGRAGWCVIFRHPLLADSFGKPGRRVRRGLDKADEGEARKLVNEMNALLGDKTMWTPAARNTAAQKYHPRIVAAFFDDLVPAGHDGWEDRNRLLPLKGTEQGYARVLLLGTTGAGKTTFLRQLIGTNPATERFPSTSTAKTTTADIEIMIDKAPFHAVVSFLTKDAVRLYVEECLVAAVLAHLDRRPRAEVARKFLEHREQRFRLSYMLGTLTPATATKDVDGADDDFLDEFNESEAVEVGEVTEEERQKLIAQLNTYLDRIEALAKNARDELAGELSYDPLNATREDRDTFEELLEDHLTYEEEFQYMADDIMDDLESRFDLLTVGNVERRRGDNWPQLWAYEAEDRDELIKLVNRFSSNYAPNFGCLLTPMVQGIRVAGPFQPAWTDGTAPKFVLMDGEGLGHTPASAATISTRITRRFADATAILLVDNAMQPMQAAPVTVLRSLVTSGHVSKLVVCFTHFDQMKGDNFRRGAGTDAIEAKKAHVMGSVDNAVAAVGKAQGRVAEADIKGALQDRIFFVANIQEPLLEKARFTRAEMDRLVEVLKSTVKQPAPSDYVPVYDDANLILAVQQAMQEFREPWRARLSFPSTAAVPPEHWSRIKALTRHIGHLGEDEYDSLRPAGELIARLQEQIAGFIDTPISWGDPFGEPTEDQVFATATARVRQQVFKRLHDYVHDRVVSARLKEWIDAYSYSGRGSTRVRAQDVETIYEMAAPIPSGKSAPFANEFMAQIRKLVRDAIHEGGGKLTSGDVVPKT